MSNYIKDYQKKLKENINLLIENSKLEEAKEILSQYESIISDDIEIYSIKGVIAMMEENMDEAERILKEGILIDAENFDLNYNLAYLYQSIGKYVEAIELYEIILDMSMSISINLEKEIIDTLDILKKKINYNDESNSKKNSEKERRKMVDFKNMQPLAIWNIAEKELTQGNDENVEIYYESLLSSKDFKSLAYIRLGEIKNRQKDIRKSFEYHNKAFETNPRLAMSVTKEDHPNHNYIYKKVEETIVSKCPICGRQSKMHSCYNMITNIDFIQGFNPIRLWMHCDKCNHIFAGSYPKKLEYILKNTAPSYHLDPKINQLSVVHDILTDVKTYAKGNRFLEIGVGAGEMTAVAKELLFDVTGVEIRKDYASSISKKLGIPVYAQNIMDFHTDNRFDVICMGDVLEHLAEPVALIEHIVSLLNEDGVLWLSTPNFESAFSLFVKDKDPMWRVCEHLNYFSFSSLKKLLETYNLEVLSYKSSKHYNGSMEVVGKKITQLKNCLTSNKFLIGKSRKLHVGCGRNIMEGWINLDLMNLQGVDVVADLDDCKNTPLPFEENSIDEFYVSHVIEHINNPLHMMQELYRIAMPNAKAVFKCPYGTSDEAFEDPTHVRQYFLNSFGYFSQPFYWRADYGYRGDWLTERIILVVDKNMCLGKTPQKIMEEVNRYRNVVKEMIVELKAIKPTREARKELQILPKIEISLN